MDAARRSLRRMLQVRIHRWFLRYLETVRCYGSRVVVNFSGNCTLSVLYGIRLVVDVVRDGFFFPATLVALVFFSDVLWKRPNPQRLDFIPDANRWIADSPIAILEYMCTYSSSKYYSLLFNMFTLFIGYFIVWSTGGYLCLLSFSLSLRERERERPYRADPTLQSKSWAGLKLAITTAMYRHGRVIE